MTNAGGPDPILLEDIDFVRGGKSILSDVSWQVRRHEHAALIGANGSGKTTLLKVVAGYEWPTRGRVRVLGEEFGKTDLRELRKRIGWVSSAITERISGSLRAVDVVASGIDAGLALYRELSPEEWGRSRVAMERVGVSYTAEQELRTLSQGEVQRVRIARALLCNPELLILDEPCAGLDPVSRREFLDDLGTFASGSDAPTLIFVTHHIEEIGPWIRQVHALKNGRTAATGPPGAVLRSEVLSDAFECPCTVHRSGNCYSPIFSHSTVD